MKQLEPKPLMKKWKWAALALFAIVLLFGRWLPAPAVFAGWAAGIVVLANLAFFTFRLLKNRFFWRVRNRLLGAFIFVGLIPLLLVVAVIYNSSLILLGQLASNYLISSIDEIGREVLDLNLHLSRQIPEGAAEPVTAQIGRRLQTAAGRFPDISARLMRKNQDGTWAVEWGTASRSLPDGYDPGVLLGEDRPHFVGLVSSGTAVRIVTLTPLHDRREQIMEVAVPLDRKLEDLIAAERSIYFYATGPGTYDFVISPNSMVVTEKESGTARKDLLEGEAAVASRLRSDPRTMVKWGAPLEGYDSATGKREFAGLAVIRVPLLVLYQHYMAGSYNLGQLLLRLIYFLLLLFVLAELGSLLIGWKISRRITQSVHDLHLGTLALQTGNLQHQIPVRRQDQLGLLAHSFNQMTASVLRLLEEVREKERLEQELQIAKEVQATLFPKQLPHSRGLEIFGGCEPARVVSGDYYDFIVEGDSRLYFVVGDISGKGISAALLMANLQAAMRSQLMPLANAPADDVEARMARVMQELNRQIFLNSPSEKYATLFLGRYDAESRKLSYCNAGHLPPVLIRNLEVSRLEAGGTVLGLFPSVAYRTETVALSAGDLLAVFTDGIPEAVNDAEEEFGEERLVTALRESGALPPESVFRHVVTQVQRWQGNLKQHDDITLIVARVE